MFGERSEVPIPSQEGYSDLSVLVRRDVVQAQKKNNLRVFVPSNWPDSIKNPVKKYI